MDIALDRNKDNPQLIFESLNSTGLDLSQADLIRNYVLMGLEPERQKRIYNDYWYPMEQNFGHAEYSPQFNRFMRDYLTVKSRVGTIPKMDEVYEIFKTYLRNYIDRVPDSSEAIEHVVAEVYRYSKYFANLAFQKEKDDQINDLFGSINKLKVDVAYPFLLEVYDDYSRSRLRKDEFLGILKLVESYVFRRAICEIPPNSLNKTFATLSRRIDKHNYLESTQAAFLSLDSYRRFPIDDEFWFKFMVRDVYNFRSRNYLLDKLENHDRKKETVNIESYTIEHIMPQNEKLSAAWQKDLGDDWEKVHAEYLHTIGNLTLTGYNSELSDRPFKDKRDMKDGFADSPIRLNGTLRKLDHWNMAEIEKRADLLASMAINIWRFPDLSASNIDKQQSMTAEDEQEHTLDQFFANSPEDQRDLFTLLRTQLLNLDASVQEFVNRDHVSYQSDATIVDVQLKKTEVRLCLHCNADQLYDPEERAMDATGQEHWSDGDTLADLSSADQIEYVMGLVRQCYESQLEESLARLL